jgi:glycosidase
MIEALCYWVRKTDIDGYRCDVAGLVPTAFWDQASDALDRIKPVFMLAEWSESELHRSAFDMTYDWALHDVMREIARGEGDVGDLLSYLDEPIPPFPPDAYRMQFTSNHDKNAWEGSDTELFGESLPVFAVIAATLPGMPLLYGGQESRLDKRLPLFEKDSIEWHDFPLAPLYSELFRLKHENPVLWNGVHGAPVDLLPCRTRDVFAFRRAAPGNEVTVVANLSGKEQTVKLEDQVKKLHLGPWCWWIDERR